MRMQEAMKKEDPKEREDLIIYLGRLMKTFYGNWNKETLDDSVILKDISNMSKGKLTMSLDKVREENLFDPLYRERPSSQQRPQGERRHQNQRQEKQPREHTKRRATQPMRLVRFGDAFGGRR